MGITITAKNSNYRFDGRYIGFARLRERIAMNLDKEFGEHYMVIRSCNSRDDYIDFDKKANEIYNRKNLDEDIVEFLFQSDESGKINYKTCKKIYDIIKEDSEPLIFTYYAHSDGKDFEKFKLFLLDCYSKKRNMIWR